MEFNNGYDSGYADALDDVRNGRVAGLGPASDKAAADTPVADTPATTFNAGVLEGYDVEKLLSTTDLNTYLDGLTDAELLALVSTETDQLSYYWYNAGVFPNDRTRLGSIIHAVMGEISSRHLIEVSE